MTIFLRYSYLKQQINTTFSVMFICLCILLLPSKVNSETNISQTQLKAALIVKFTDYIKWPNEKNFDQFNIAIIGQDKAVLNELKKGLVKTKIKMNAVRVTHYKNLSFDPHKYQVVYVTQDAGDKVKNIARRIRNSATLLITDGSSLTHDFMINLKVTKQNRVAFDINRSNLIYERLSIDNQILLLGGTELQVAELLVENERALDSLRTDLEQREKRLLSLEQSLISKQDELKQAAAKLTASSASIKGLEKKYNKLSVEYIDKQKRLKEYENQMLIKSQELTEAEQQLKKNNESLQEDLVDLQRNAEILELFEQEKNELKAAIASGNITILQQKEDIEKAKAELNQHQQALTEQKALLQVSIVTAIVFLVLIIIALYYLKMRKRYEAQLIEARIEAERANRAKSDFLSQMSHELRTPLNAILGFCQLLELDKSNLQDTQQENISEIYSAGHHLLNLINDVLDLAKIESGKFDVDIGPIEVTKLIKQSLSMVRTHATERHLTIKTRNADEPLFINADFARLKQVMLHFLSNAIKYNKDQGQIIIECDISHASRVKIKVIDTGEGLSQESLEKLYEPFERFSKNTSIEGTGIGLVITKHLIEMMGGEMGVTSILGEGSTFWVEFDLVG